MAAVQKPEGLHSLDQVDLGRQIARDFETNFLLAYIGLRPNFHGVSSEYLQVLPVFANDGQTFCDHKLVMCYIISIH